MLTAYFFAGHVAIHPISESNTLGEAVEWRETNTGVHSILVDPSNRFAFAAHIADRPPDGQPGVMRTHPSIRKPPINAIMQFKFDDKTGRLSPNDPPWITAPGPLGPRHPCFHPTKPILYVANEQDASVTAYAFDREKGTLAREQTIRTIPDDVVEHCAPSDIHIHPNGHLLFVSNRYHSGIAIFRVDEAGRLAPVDWQPTEANPRSFALDSSGRFLLCASTQAGSLSSFSVDQDSGKLTLIERHYLGNKPMWVLPVNLSQQ